MDKKLFTVKEAAEMLTIPEPTLQDWVFKRKLTVVRVGEKLIRIPKEEIERLMKVIPAQEY